nr:DNA-directed DNA polymerase [Tanacetum cinerariifolium]
MCTRSSSSNLIGESSPNPTTSNPKCRNRRRSKQPFILEESPVDTMADQSTMAELLRAPTEGAARRWLEKEPPHSILTWEDLGSKFINEFFPPSRTTNLYNEISNFQQRFDESFHEAWDHYKDLLRACPHHGFTELNQLNSAAGGNLLERRTQDVLTIIENKSKDNIQGYVLAAVVNYNQASIQQNQFVPLSELEKIKKMNEINIKAMQTQINNVKNELRNEMKTSTQASMSNQTNEIKNMMASFFQMNTASTLGLGPLPSNTIANSKGELKAITTRSGLVLDRAFVYMPSPFINLEEVEHVEETLTDPDLPEYTIKVPPPLKMLKALFSNKEKLLELANTPLNENCSAVILNKLPGKLGDPGKFLIPYGFSELKCKALADLDASINLMPLSVWKKLGLPELISTRVTLELANRAICTPTGIARAVFNLVGKFTFPADFVIVDYESDPRVLLILGRPFLRTVRALIDVHGEEMILRDDLFATNHLSGNPTFSSHTNLTSPKVINPLSGNPTSSSPNHLLEEFTDELALITFPSRNNDLPFNIESDLRDKEYLLNHDHTKDMDSIFKDSVDEYNLADPNNDLFDTIPEMFTDGHTLDYSSLPLYDDFDDDLVELESSVFLSSPEYDSFLYEDFSKVDVLPSTNNKDKVFNLGILTHENLFEVTVRVATDKNVKKISISNASLILEILILLFMKFLSRKKFSSPKLYSRFLPKIRKKFSNPGFSLLKEFILLFSWNYLIGALKLSKSLKLLNARWRFFLALIERTSTFWMFRVSISIPMNNSIRGSGQAK